MKSVRGVLSIAITLLLTWSNVDAQRDQCRDDFGTLLCSAYVRTNQCKFVVRNCRFSCGFCTQSTGVWRSWGSYGRCSVSCGKGVRRRYRNCRGSGCVGSSSSTQPCSLPPCKSGVWSSWSAYGDCSVTCGEGTKTRYRTCKGRNCPGSNKGTESCFLSKCSEKHTQVCSEPSWCKNAVRRRPTYCRNKAVSAVCPRSCEICSSSSSSNFGVLGSWSNWGRCSKTCGKGTRTRTRKCVGGTSCSGATKMTGKCQTQPCKRDPKPTWSKWSEYSSCNKKCGGGTQTKKRVCRPDDSCPGSATSTRKCNTKPCNTKGEWGPWSPYSHCSKTCGNGKKIRNRTCKSRPCQGAGREGKKCNLGECNKRKGEWGPWTEFGKCSKTCGDGLLQRYRRCMKGKCQGPNRDKIKCNVKECGNGKGWGAWGEYSKCTKSCGDGTQTRTRKCNVKHCKGSTKETKKCNTKPCISEDGNWSPCTKTCGTGTRFKFDSPSCTSPNNPECFRSFEECNTNACPEKTCPLTTRHRYGINYDCCYSGGGRRIINGGLANLEDWPWMVLVEEPGLQICGGALLNNQWILTAGHCVGYRRSDQLRLRIFIGIEKYSEKFDAEHYAVEDVKRHPQFNAESLEHDIALVKLKRAAPFSLRTRAVELPFGEETPLDTTCYVAGWGITDAKAINPAPSEDLLKVGVQILDVAVCQKPYYNDEEVLRESKEYIKGTDKLLCAGSLSKANDACGGDSGGPLVCQRCSSCDWYVAGITSFGPPFDCGKPGYPGMYIKVKEYEEWIYEHIPSLKLPNGKSCSYKFGP